MVNNKTIRHWAEDDRPREKLLRLGRKSLSNAELLSILLATGTAGSSALSLSQEILSSVGNSLDNLSKLETDELCKFKGVGKAKSVRIVAALELGQRKLSLKEAVKYIKASADVYQIMHPLINDLSYEEFWVLFLNHSNKVIDKSKISQGGVTATIVDVRIILKKALTCNATGMILCHNHPSGAIRPSLADKKLTSKLKEAASIMDIRLLDHVIVTQHDYFSFADNALLT